MISLNFLNFLPEIQEVQGLLALPCPYTIQGRVLDEVTSAPMSFVNIYVQELGTGETTDDEGRFAMRAICPGEYHLHISHIGCEPKKLHFHIHGDTVLTIRMAHTSVSLDAIHVEEHGGEHVHQPTIVLGRQKIEDQLGDNLAGLLANEVGVTLLKNGNAIAKPIVQGLYGNRLVFINNGLVQGGQQWGNDHGPEIDPQSAKRITIVKGGAAIEHGGGNLGNVVLIEPQQISREPHLHGSMGYRYRDNGRSHSSHVQLQQYHERLSWNFNGGFKRSGDRRTPDYFLTNTGSREVSAALQLERSWNDQSFIQAYFSTFQTDLGILRGSHIGNLTDLQNALERDVPYFTDSLFNYTINAPRQDVRHHLGKLEFNRYTARGHKYSLILGYQQNIRKEFDVRRSGRSDIPALSLVQHTFSTHAKYRFGSTPDRFWQIGHQSQWTDNTNNPETGILPLIPDYFSIRNGIYLLSETSSGRWTYQNGLRYDVEWQNVAAISKTLPREILRFRNVFHNVSVSSTLKWWISDFRQFQFNLGYAGRNPAINELYSNGLHQGVSGIEEGDAELRVEHSLKATVEYKYFKGSVLAVEPLIYVQRFKDYIYLRPTGQTELTIRGAFPVFRYAQTDAYIAGLDLPVKASLGRSLQAQLKYSFIYGRDIDEGLALINIPSNNLLASLSYRSAKTFGSSRLKIDDVEAGVNYRYTFRQSHITADQDFVVPPDGYHLIGLNASAELVSPVLKGRFVVTVDNLFNAVYRDYLNRQRYFADEEGRSIAVGFYLKF